MVAHSTYVSKLLKREKKSLLFYSYAFQETLLVSQNLITCTSNPTPSLQWSHKECDYRATVIIEWAEMTYLKFRDKMITISLVTHVGFVESTLEFWFLF